MSSMTVSLWQWTPNVITTCWKPFSYLSWDVATGIWRERVFSRTVPQPIRHDSEWTLYVLHSPGDFSLGSVTLSGLPIHRTLLQLTIFMGGIWKLKFLLIPSLTLTALKMQFIRRLRMLRRTIYVASWQVYLGDGSKALSWMNLQDVVLKTWGFLWIQDTDLLDRVQLCLLLCTRNVLPYFQNGPSWHYILLYHHSHNRDNATAPHGRPNLRSRLHFCHAQEGRARSPQGHVGAFDQKKKTFKMGNVKCRTL